MTAQEETIAAPIAFDAALWQAARDTIGFLPVEKADPVAGLIETGWGYARGDIMTRYKVTVHLTYGRPYAKAAQVLVASQIRENEEWADRPTPPAIAAGLAHDIALTAEELRRPQRTGN